MEKTRSEKRKETKGLKMEEKDSLFIEGHTERLALFQNVPTDTSIDSVNYIRYRPIGQIGQGTVIEFNVLGNTSSFIDLKRSTLKVSCKILQSNGDALPKVPKGTDIPTAAKVGAVNNFLHSLFSQVDVSLQQRVITPTVGTNYAYKSFFDTELNSNATVKMTRLQSRLYHRDSAGETSMDDADPQLGSNDGLGIREKYSRASKVFEMEGEINMDIMQQPRLIPNGVDINIKLYPNITPFILMSSNPKPEYKVVITDAALNLCAVSLKPEVLLGIMDTLKTSPLLYPITRSDIKVFSVPSGQFEFTADDLYSGKVPTRLIVGVTAGKNYSGDFKGNPYNFKSYSCQTVALYVDGQSVPGEPIQCNFKESKYLGAYRTLFAAPGAEEKVLISREDYPHGYCIYVFDVDTPQSTDYQAPGRNGQTRLTLKFSKALPETVSIIAYAQFPGLVKIDQARNIIQ